MSDAVIKIHVNNKESFVKNLYVGAREIKLGAQDINHKQITFSTPKRL